MGKILVTGAAGFIGSRLSRSLLERGDRVVGLDNLDPFYPVEHKERNLRDLLRHPDFQFVRADLTDAGQVLAAFEQYRPDGVAHLAAMANVRYSVNHPLLYGRVNVQGSLNVLEAARQTTNPVLVLASTGSVYGSSTPVPFVETAAADMPLAPYPASKRAMELFAHSFHHLHGLRICAVRFFNVYGPHGRPDMMPWQWTLKIQAGEPITLYDGGRLKRDWTYVDDIVRGLTGALDAGFGWEILNLGCGRPVENVDFVRTLEGLLGKRAVIEEVPRPPSEPVITFADTSRAAERIGYRPQVAVEEGLARFIDWLRAESLLPPGPSAG